jgi:hypothetical protein
VRKNPHATIQCDECHRWRFLWALPVDTSTFTCKEAQVTHTHTHTHTHTRTHGSRHFFSTLPHPLSICSIVRVMCGATIASTWPVKLVQMITSPVPVITLISEGTSIRTSTPQSDPLFRSSILCPLLFLISSSVSTLLFSLSSSPQWASEFATNHTKTPSLSGVSITGQFQLA